MNYKKIILTIAALSTFTMADKFMCNLIIENHIKYLDKLALYEKHRDIFNHKIYVSMIKSNAIEGMVECKHLPEAVKAWEKIVLDAERLGA